MIRYTAEPSDTGEIVNAFPALHGPLPAALQQITVYSAGIPTSAKVPDAAQAMVRALTTPEAVAIFKSKGLGL